MKATSVLSGKKYIINFLILISVNGVTGHECVNELIIDRLLNILGFEHLHYRLIHADIRVDGKILDTYLSSDDFKEKEEEKTALDIFYELEKTRMNR